MSKKFVWIATLVVILALAVPWAAFADDLSIDNDVVDPGNQNSVSLTYGPGELVSTTAQVLVQYQGSSHLASGTTLKIGVAAQQTDLPAGYTVSEVSATVPGNWDDNKDWFTAGTSTIQFTAPTTPASYQYTVKWDDTSKTCKTATDDCVSGSNAFTIKLTVSAPVVTDSDGDGVADSSDNCPTVANADQANADGDGLGNACDTNAYAPVVATAAADASGNEGGTLSTSGAFSDQDGNSSLTITMLSGAGSFTAGANGTWSWSLATTDNGSGTVLVQASDGEHAAVTDSFDWAAANVAPTATFNAPSSVNEGSAIALSLTSPYDPSSVDTTAGFTYAFDCGDGAGYGSFSSTASASCATDDNGTRSAKGKIQDKDGGISEHSASVTINNVPPAVSALALGNASATACQTGNVATLDFSFSDPGVNDNPWAVDINWGDGNHTTYSASAQGIQAQQSHTYGVGSYTVSVTVTDKDGGPGTSSSAQNAVSFLYNMTGILAPFNPDGTSVWKFGSTLPVKVKITDCNNQAVSGLAPKVGTSLFSSTDPTIAIGEAASTSAADTTGIMRYSASDGQYIYNFGSKNLIDPSASYWMTVKGTDSNGNIVTNPPMVQVKFGLKIK